LSEIVVQVEDENMLQLPIDPTMDKDAINQLIKQAEYAAQEL
jgi:hypothetical protein